MAKSHHLTAFIYTIERLFSKNTDERTFLTLIMFSWFLIISKRNQLQEIRSKSVLFHKQKDSKENESNPANFLLAPTP